MPLQTLSKGHMLLDSPCGTFQIKCMRERKESRAGGKGWS
jgi:hypothetical protein